MDINRKKLSDILDEIFTYNTVQSGELITLQCIVARSISFCPVFSGLVPIAIVGVITKAEHLITFNKLAYRHSTILWLPKDTLVEPPVMDFCDIHSIIF